jgi:hypothetical protein
VGGEVVLRPDALVVLAAGHVEDVWWLEIDRGTESLPRLRTALERYLTFAGLGIPGPSGVVPRVLISVTSQERLRAADGLLRRLPPPADVLFGGSRDEEVAERMIGELLGEIRAPPR